MDPGPECVWGGERISGYSGLHGQSPCSLPMVSGSGVKLAHFCITTTWEIGQFVPIFVFVRPLDPLVPVNACCGPPWQWFVLGECFPASCDYCAQVQVGTDSAQTYAMKKLKKVHIVKTRQQEHVMNEKSIMLDCHSDFIARFVPRVGCGAVRIGPTPFPDRRS